MNTTRSMPWHTRQVLLLLTLLGAVSGPVNAQSFPAKPLRIMVGFSAGSGTDTVGRTIAQGMAEVLGQQVIIENRAGAGGNIGAELVAKAPPDGYSLLLANVAYAANATLYRNLTYDLQRDFAPIGRFATGPYIVLSHPSLPVKSIGEMVKLAKTRPGAILYSSGGAGSATFLATEIFKSLANVNLMHVPYKSGAEATTAVMSGEVSLHLTNAANGIPHAQHGKLRGLAVTSAARLPNATQYPTIAESGYPGYEFGNWYGLMAPAKTPRDAITSVRGAVLAAMKSPAVSKRLIDYGYLSVSDQPEEFGAYIRSEVEKLARIIKAHNLTAD